MDAEMDAVLSQAMGYKGNNRMLTEYQKKIKMRTGNDVDIRQDGDSINIDILHPIVKETTK